MATAQALPLTQDLYPASSLAWSECSMGSVGSLVEKADDGQNKGLLKKSFNQRELLNYLNMTKRETRPAKLILSGSASIKREHSSEEDNIYTKVYHKDGREVDLTKNSLPSGGKFDKPRVRASAFKPVTPKNFSSVQNLYPSKSEELPSGTKPASKSLSSSSSSSSPSRGATSANKGVLATPRALSQEAEETASDSGHNSMSSLPPYRPPHRAHLQHISASTGHINHISSLEPTSLNSAGGLGGGPAGRSLATLGRLQGYCGEAPPPYELSLFLEEVVKELEERLQEKELELRHMRRNLDESEDAIAQVFEGKQRLWEKEVAELKQLYSTKLRQITQQSQRSHRTLQLQLYKSQQERSRLQEQLQTLRLDFQSLQSRETSSSSQELHPQLEETQWEVCQKAGEISLLKQQLRDSQAEVTQKLSEIFRLKTELRETRGEVRTRDQQVELLQAALQAERRKGVSYEELQEGRGSGGPTEERLRAELRETRGEVRTRDQQVELLQATLQAERRKGVSYEELQEGRGPGGATEERLRAELLLERRQSEAQASAFQAERETWQLEKEKVIRYQRQLQASYLDMHRKNQSLEKELGLLRGGGASEGGGASDEDERPPSGLPWIERIESSEI